MTPETSIQVTSGASTSYIQTDKANYLYSVDECLRPRLIEINYTKLEWESMLRLPYKRPFTTTVGDFCGPDVVLYPLHN